MRLGFTPHAQPRGAPNPQQQHRRVWARRPTPCNLGMDTLPMIPPEAAAQVLLLRRMGKGWARAGFMQALTC